MGLAQPADEKFGRLMTLNDDLIGIWATVYTELPIAAVQELAHHAASGGAVARDAKLDLAEEIVSRYHGAPEARRARQAFLDVFSKRKLPDVMPELLVTDPMPSVFDLVSAARPELTRSAVRRLIAEGGVRINGAQQPDAQAAPAVCTGDVLQTGKRRWFSVVARQVDRGES